MQIYAYDDLGDEVGAPRAQEKKNYYCPNCHQVLRVRSGPFIRTHFFHYKPKVFCSHSGKTSTHLELQATLLRLLPPGEVKEEARFPKISRIADIYWPKEKLVFEVQVSFISAKEVKERNQAYRSLGLEVVWILHKSRFDRYKVTAAEHYLKRSPHYYSNHDETGIGHFYDRFAYDVNGLKQPSLFKRPVDLSRPIRDPKIPPFFPSSLHCRSTWPLHFKGDILSAPSLHPEDLEKAAMYEALLARPFKKGGWLVSCRRFFRFIGYLLLDTAAG